LSAAVSSSLSEQPSNRQAPAGAPETSAPREAAALHVWVVIGAALLVCLVAISARSLWIDEAATAVQATQPTLKAWWQLLVQEKTAHLQMPRYMLYIWAHAKVCGSGEWALRLASLPWFVAGAVAFVLGFPAGDRRRVIAACVVLARAALRDGTGRLCARARLPRGGQAAGLRHLGTGQAIRPTLWPDALI